jgi:hypothetical protein
MKSNTILLEKIKNLYKYIDNNSLFLKMFIYQKLTILKIFVFREEMML